MVKLNCSAMCSLNAGILFYSNIVLDILLAPPFSPMLASVHATVGTKERMLVLLSLRYVDCIHIYI